MDSQVNNEDDTHKQNVQNPAIHVDVVVDVFPIQNKVNEPHGIILKYKCPYKCVYAQKYYWKRHTKTFWFPETLTVAVDVTLK